MALAKTSPTGTKEKPRRANTGKDTFRNRCQHNTYNKNAQILKNSSVKTEKAMCACKCFRIFFPSKYMTVIERKEKDLEYLI